MQLDLFNPEIGLLSGATILGQSQPGSDVNKGVLHIPQSSRITGTSPSDCLVSYLGHSLGGGSYPTAEKHSVYSTVPANWVRELLGHIDKKFLWRYQNEAFNTKITISTTNHKEVSCFENPFSAKITRKLERFNSIKKKEDYHEIQRSFNK